MSLHASDKTSSKGLINLPKGIVLVASQPITMLDGSVPSQGSLIFAQYLSESSRKDFARITHLDLHYYSLDCELPNNIKEVKSLLSVNEATILPVSKDEIGELHHSINAMLEEIEQSHVQATKLQEATDILEHQVETRTEALNTDLKESNEMNEVMVG